MERFSQYLQALLLLLALTCPCLPTQPTQLQQFIALHTQHHRLSPSPSSSPSSTPTLYLHSCPQQSTLCYRAPSTWPAPQLLPQRSHHSLLHPQIHCYTIFDKEHLQTRTQYVPPVQEQQAGLKKKKEIELMEEEFRLLEWEYGFGREIGAILDGFNKERSGTGAVLEIDGLVEFAIALFYNQEGKLAPTAVYLAQPNPASSTITKKLTGKGLHQHTLYTIELNATLIDITAEHCHVAIHEVLPHTTYIDVDELKGYGYNVTLAPHQSHVNVQVPEYMARQYEYVLRVGWGEWRNVRVDGYELAVPVHFRYPTPYQLKKGASEGAKPGKKDPIVEYKVVDMHPISRAYIQCSNGGATQMYPLKENYLVDKGRALVPVGDGEMKSVVSLVTLGAEVLCALLIVRQLKK